MRVLLDESIPIDFAHDLHALHATTVIGIGWAGLKNGSLLRQTVAASEPGKLRVVGA